MQGLAEKYRVTTEENRRLYNEVQDLKGNIRVFCRVRPAGATGDGAASERPSTRQLTLFCSRMAAQHASASGAHLQSITLWSG